MASGLRDRYLETGFVHLTGIFGDREIDSAIAEVEPLPGWIRSKSGDRNVQRVQPLQSCAALADPGWIRTFYDNPRLDRPIAEIFHEAIHPAPKMSRDRQLTALLIEPLERWWSTGLHRDYRDFLPNLDMEDWNAKAADPRFFNQINIPLLPDANFWLIPGSHRRADSPDEARLVETRERYRRCQRTPLSPEAVDACRSELADALRACGAINLVAQPGDLVLYRSNMLHCGVYEPGVRRLTLHDAVYSAQWHRYALDTLMRSRGATSRFRAAPSG